MVMSNENPMLMRCFAARERFFEDGRRCGLRLCILQIFPSFSFFFSFFFLLNGISVVMLKL